MSIWTNKLHYFLLIYFNSKPLDVLSRHAAHHEEDQLFINSNWYSHALCWLAAGRIRMEIVPSQSDVCVCSYLCTIQLSPLVKISMSALSGIHVWTALDFENNAWSTCRPKPDIQRVPEGTFARNKAPTTWRWPPLSASVMNVCAAILLLHHMPSWCFA